MAIHAAQRGGAYQAPQVDVTQMQQDGQQVIRALHQRAETAEAAAQRERAQRLAQVGDLEQEVVREIQGREALERQLEEKTRQLTALNARVVQLEANFQENAQLLSASRAEVRALQLQVDSLNRQLRVCNQGMDALRAQNEQLQVQNQRMTDIALRQEETLRRIDSKTQGGIFSLVGDLFTSAASLFNPELYNYDKT